MYDVHYSIVYLHIFSLTYYKWSTRWEFTYFRNSPSVYLVTGELGTIGSSMSSRCTWLHRLHVSWVRLVVRCPVSCTWLHRLHVSWVRLVVRCPVSMSPCTSMCHDYTDCTEDVYPSSTSSDCTHLWYCLNWRGTRAWVLWPDSELRIDRTAPRNRA
jgi:hypothetical protein